jgi:hypothetical protein
LDVSPQNLPPHLNRQAHDPVNQHDEWREAGECDSPGPSGAKAKISLQFYQGPANIEHWARVTEFRIRRVGR